MDDTAFNKGAVVEDPGVGGKLRETLVEAVGGAGFVELVEGVASEGIGDAVGEVLEAIEGKLERRCFSSIKERPLAM